MSDYQSIADTLLNFATVASRVRQIVHDIAMADGNSQNFALPTDIALYGSGLDFSAERMADLKAKLEEEFNIELLESQYDTISNLADLILCVGALVRNAWTSSVAGRVHKVLHILIEPPAQMASHKEPGKPINIGAEHIPSLFVALRAEFNVNLQLPKKHAQRVPDGRWVVPSLNQLVHWIEYELEKVPVVAPMVEQEPPQGTVDGRLRKVLNRFKNTTAPLDFGDALSDKLRIIKEADVGNLFKALNDEFNIRMPNPRRVRGSNALQVPTVGQLRTMVYDAIDERDEDGDDDGPVDRSMKVPKKAVDVAPKRRDKAPAPVPAEFSDVWLHDVCNRFVTGSITNIDLVLQLQVHPDVIEAMLAVSRLPFQASRKIEISDLLHDDPRIEMAKADVKSDAALTTTVGHATPRHGINVTGPTSRQFVGAILRRADMDATMALGVAYPPDRMTQMVGIIAPNGNVAQDIYRFYHKFFISGYKSKNSISIDNRMVWISLNILNKAGVTVPDVMTSWFYDEPEFQEFLTAIRNPLPTSIACANITFILPQSQQLKVLGLFLPDASTALDLYTYLCNAHGDKYQLSCDTEERTVWLDLALLHIYGIHVPQKIQDWYGAEVRK